MERFFETLRPLIRAVARRPGPVLLCGLILAAVGLFFTMRLRVDNDFAKLIPSDYPSVQALDTLRKTVGGESEAVVVIESPSFAANKRFAEELIPRVLALQGRGYAEPYFNRVLYRRDVDFLKDNALYFATTAELDSLKRFLEDEIEQAKLEANPFYFELEDEEEDTTAATLEAAYDRLVGTEYPISDDSTTMAVRFFPSGAQTDIDFIRDAFRDLERLVEAMQPATYHPQMEVVFAGRLLRQLIEVDTIIKDVRGSFGAGVVTLLVMVALYFFYKSYRARVGRRFVPRVVLAKLVRMPVTALVIGVPLLASEAWTFGLAYGVYGSLNMMTSTLGLVLFGLGIDFGIHFYARYAEERGRGRTVAEAVEVTFMTTGQAIAGVGVTTSAAFFILMLADFKGFSQYGFIAGTGILFALVAMTVLLPALVVFFERTRLLNLTALESHPPLQPAQANGHARKAYGRFPAHTVVLGVCVLALTVALFALPDVAFEYHFGSLTPEYEEYETVQRRARRVYSDKATRNAAYILADDPEDVPAVVEALREHMAQDTLTPTIRAVESLQDRFPMAPEAQQAKLDRIAEIRDLLDSTYLTGSDDPHLERLRRAASTRDPITLDEVPDFLKESFTTKRGEVGNLVLIYPQGSLSHGKHSMRFADDVGTVVTDEGTVYHAASTSIVASDMLRLMIRETPWMVGLTILVIVVFKFIILGRPKWVLLALLPLVASFLWMFGLMTVFGLKLNFYNLVVLPTVLGIGDDSGIHIVHRYLEEGRGSIRLVLRSTGEHISMSAVTTMVGFGGLLLSMYPGLRSIGELAVLGIGMTLLAALVFLPALLQWLEDRSRTAPPARRRPAAVQSA